MKTILLVNATYVGFHVFLRELADRLHSESWAVHIASSSTNYPGDHQSNQDADFTMHEIDFPRGANLIGYRRAAQQLSSVVKETSPDIVHAHMHPAIIATALARNNAWPTTYGTFQGLVSPMLSGPKSWVYNRIERWAAGQLTGAFVLTEGDACALPLPNVSLQSAPGFGANQKRFDPARYSDADRSNFRAEQGIKDGAIVFTFLGRQTQFKGFPETAKAAVEVVKAQPNAHFLFVGTVDPRHPVGLEQNQRETMESHPRIHMMGWNDDIPKLLFASDCLVFPSSREGLSVCIMEALSMGLPVITTSARGCGELVTHGQNGWIVEKSMESVLKQVMEICQHPESLKEFRERILAKRERYSRERFIVEQMQLYAS